MNNNLAYADIDKVQLIPDSEIQNTDEPAALRELKMIWLKKGFLQAHAFHRNGSMSISICGQETTENFTNINQPDARDATNCARCEKLIRKLSRMKPISSGFREILSVHHSL